MEITTAIGWLSSMILVATLIKQIWKQWTTRSSEGVSTWLFIGQTAAQTGFVAYSILVGDPVFIFTNSVLLLVSLLGIAVFVRNRRSAKEPPPADAKSAN